MNSHVRVRLHQAIDRFSNYPMQLLDESKVSENPGNPFGIAVACKTGFGVARFVQEYQHGYPADAIL